LTTYILTNYILRKILGILGMMDNFVYQNR